MYDQGAWWAQPAANYMPGSLSPGSVWMAEVRVRRVRSAWGEGARWEQWEQGRQKCRPVKLLTGARLV